MKDELKKFKDWCSENKYNSMTMFTFTKHFEVLEKSIIANILKHGDRISVIEKRVCKSNYEKYLLEKGFNNLAIAFARQKFLKKLEARQ